MTIAEAREKCKSLIARIPRDILIISILILASSASFGLGYLAGVPPGQGTSALLQEPPSVVSSTSGQVVASKNGTKYYLLGCAGSERISDANKIWFTSAAEASKAGYAPATNCKGL